MKKFKFLPPYKKPGQTSFPETQNRSGVYLVKENNRLVYIGMSARNLYKTLYRHFETWDHPSQVVVTYKSRLKKHKYTVRVVLCTPGQAARLERLLILKYNPRDNDLKYKGYQLTAFDERMIVMYENEPINQAAPF